MDEWARALDARARNWLVLRGSRFQSVHQQIYLGEAYSARHLQWRPAVLMSGCLLSHLAGSHCKCEAV